jgi:ERCC4-type nuclease
MNTCKIGAEKKVNNEDSSKDTTYAISNDMVKKDSWVLEIDSRESFVFSHEPTLVFPLCIVKKQLLVGDAQLLKNNKPIIIIERKSISDLLASLSDGRYSEQKSRMISSLAIHKAYIIEGDPFAHKIVQQIIIRLQLKDTVKCFLTRSKEDTFSFLMLLCQKIMKDSKLYNSSETNQKMNPTGNELIDQKSQKNQKMEEIAQNYTSTLHLSKKKNLNPSRCFEIQIAQIPGISLKTSQCITSKYSSWGILLEALNKMPSSSFLDTLDKTHRIGKKSIDLLKEYCFISNKE